jgi:hypothetical protein
MNEMSSQEWHEAVRQGLDEVTRRLEAGELDGSGRFWTDEELAAGAATGGTISKEKTKLDKTEKAPAA